MILVACKIPFRKVSVKYFGEWSPGGCHRAIASASKENEKERGSKRELKCECGPRIRWFLHSVCEQRFGWKRLFVIRSVTRSLGGGPLFVPEKNLKDLVVSYLREQERSISGLTKRLKQDGYNFHRLFVTGYLKALSDVGVLREKDIPPSKVYTTSVHREPNLYELLGSRCREVAKDESDRVRLAIGVLQKLFHRPIFLRELRECGFAGAIDASQASREEREEARRGLVNLGLQLPTNEPAYAVPNRRNEIRDGILYDLIVERFGMGGMVLETKQMKLTDR